MTRDPARTLAHERIDTLYDDPACAALLTTLLAIVPRASDTARSILAAASLAAVTEHTDQVDKGRVR